MRRQVRVNLIISLQILGLGVRHGLSSVQSNVRWRLAEQTQLGNGVEMRILETMKWVAITRVIYILGNYKREKVVHQSKPVQ